MEEKKEEILKLLVEFLNSKSGFEYACQTDDLCLISRKERYNHQIKLERMLSDMEKKLRELGYTIYVYE